MKRFFTGLFLALTILSLLAAVIWCGYCAWDYRQMLAVPGLSGIDFLMQDTFYGIGLALICLVGAVCGLVHNRLTVNVKLQVFSYIVIGVFCVAGSAAFFLMIL